MISTSESRINSVSEIVLLPEAAVFWRASVCMVSVYPEPEIASAKSISLAVRLVFLPRVISPLKL